jgi:hypothetical protein
MAKRREKGKIPHQEWPAIRTRYAAGESLASIARDYGCTGPAIRYIVNRPADADAPVPAVAAAEPPARRPAPAPATIASDVPSPVRPDLTGGHSGDAPASAPIDPELRWRVSSEIASFLAVFDSFLTENSPESYDELLGATDRLMRVAARTRIELERARTSEHSRLRQGRPAARPRVAAS